MVYQSSKEAEYTAAFCFVVTIKVAHWAVQVGRARLRVGRMPCFQPVGNRQSWPAWPANAALVSFGPLVSSLVFGLMPLGSLGLTAGEHFRRPCLVGMEAAPLISAPALDEDLSLAGVKWELRLLQVVQPGPRGDFLWDASLKDAAKGRAAKTVPWSKFCQQLRGRKCRRTRRKVAVQLNAKQRCIDDVQEGGQTKCPSVGSKWQLCSAMLPVQHVACLAQEVQAAGGHLADVADTMNTGGEDWPDACGSASMGRED